MNSTNSEKESNNQPQDESKNLRDKCGLLFVKFPAGSRGNSWKVWGRKFVSIKNELLFRPESVVPCALLTVYRSEKPDLSDIIFKKRLTPQNTIIFRSKSRTQLHAFTVCVDDEPILHLSSYSESDSQEWISSLRSILWPPTTFAVLESTLGSHFQVSIIDNEFAFRAGLIGMYGNLMITSRKAVLNHPQNNTIIKEWELSTVGFKFLPQSHPEDQNKVLTMITDSNSVTGYGTIVMFCREGEALISRVHQVRQMFMTKSYGQQVKEDLEREKSADNRHSLAESYSHYVMPGSSEDSQVKDENELQDHHTQSRLNAEVEKQLSDTDDNPPPKLEKKFTWKTFSNISEIMLDSSVNFRNKNRPISECPSEMERQSKSDEDGNISRLYEKAAAEVDKPPQGIP